MYAKAGLLTGKEDKAGDFIVSGVNRGHTLYEEFRPYKRQPQDGGGAAAAVGPGGVAADSSSGVVSGSGDAGSSQLVIEEVFKPTRELKRARGRGRWPATWLAVGVGVWSMAACWA